MDQDTFNCGYQQSRSLYARLSYVLIFCATTAVPDHTMDNGIPSVSDQRDTTFNRALHHHATLPPTPIARIGYTLGLGLYMYTMFLIIVFVDSHDPLGHSFEIVTYVLDTILAYLKLYVACMYLLASMYILPCVLYYYYVRCASQRADFQINTIQYNTVT